MAWNQWADRRRITDRGESMAEGATSVAARTEQAVHGPGDASTLPYEWYVDTGRFGLEQQRIFSRTWQYVGHVGRVAAPGDFFTTQLGELSVVITRDEDGELHALRNVCCHRSAEVVLAAEGNRKTLQSWRTSSSATTARSRIRASLTQST
jgi:hypothetical protein